MLKYSTTKIIEYKNKTAKYKSKLNKEISMSRLF